MVIVITVVALITLWFVNRSIRSFNDQISSSLALEVQTIAKMFERENILKLEKVQTNLRVANIQFFAKPLVVYDDSITIEVENQRTNQRHEAVLPVWVHGGERLYGHHAFVDFMEEVIGGTITVFQKIDSGFVRVSTNIRKSDGSRAVGTYIPNVSPVAETVTQGEVYYGRAFVVDDWYTTAYEPVIIDNEVVGMLYVGDKEKDMDELQRILHRLRIGNSGYPFVFDNEGTLLIHPEREGEPLRERWLIDSIVSNKSGLLEFSENGHTRTVAYRYFEPFELYVAATVVNDLENRALVRNAVSGAIMIGSIAILLLLFFIYRFTSDRLYKYLDALAVSKAKLADAEQALKQSEKLAHMGQISAGIAHELNNPLGVITMYSGIVQDELPEDSPLHSDIDLIVEQANRCKHIVSGLLNFARRNKVVATKVNIVDFLEHSLNNVIIPKNIKSAVHSNLEDPEVMLDKEQMMQAFVNLEKNAVEAMPDGGELNIYIRGDEDTVTVTIADTGTGISKKDMDNLFTPFFTTKLAGKGTGLGLSLVYGVVKMHKGGIRAKSNADPAQGPTGTQFIITLPRTSS